MQQIITKLLLATLLTTLLPANYIQIPILAKHLNTPKNINNLNDNVFGVVYHDKYNFGFYYNSSRKISIVFGKDFKKNYYYNSIGFSLNAVTGYNKLIYIVPSIFTEFEKIRIDIFPTIIDKHYRTGVSFSLLF